MEALRDADVLITGAASGIGRALAGMAIEAGANVVLIDVDRTALDALAHGGRARAVPMSVAEAEAWQALEAPEGGWDFVALNAGVMSAPRDAPLEASDFLTISDEQYRRIVGVNLDGVALGLRTTLPRLKARGAIVATASIAGFMAFANDPAYAMTKHGVIGLVRGVAAQLDAQEKSQRLCAICPGGVHTNIVPDYMSDSPGLMGPEVIAREIVDLWASGENGEVRAKVLADHPAQRVAEPSLEGFDLATN